MGSMGLSLEVLLLAAKPRGDSSVAIERLGRLDQMLAALPSTRPGGWIRLRAPAFSRCRRRLPQNPFLTNSVVVAIHCAPFPSGAAVRRHAHTFPLHLSERTLRRPADSL